MRKFLGAFLLLAQLATAQPPLVLVIGDLNQVEVTVRESKLRQRLRELRDAGKLDAQLAGYNLALADHRKSLQKLGFSASSLPMLLVCTQNSQGLPLAVEWSTRVDTPEAAVRELVEYLGDDPPTSDSEEVPASLSLAEPSIQVGAQSGVINVKVRLSNSGSTTLGGPLRVVLWTQLPGQDWKAAGEQPLDKLPGGWNLTKDFFIVEAADLLNSAFQVKAQVFRASELLKESSASRAFP